MGKVRNGRELLPIVCACLLFLGSFYRLNLCPMNQKESVHVISALSYCNLQSWLNLSMTRDSTLVGLGGGGGGGVCVVVDWGLNLQFLNQARPISKAT